MKKSKKPSEKLTRKEKTLIVTLCIVCFGAGISVPLLIQRGKGVDSQEFTKLETVYDLMKNKWFYADQLDSAEDQLIEQAIEGMTTNEIDPHTTYMGLDQAKKFSEVLSGSNVGIGVGFYRNETGNMVVRSVYINSAADQAGLREGDIITKVGSLSCAQATTDEIINTIKNHADQNLDIKYERDGQSQSTTIKPGEYDPTDFDPIIILQNGNTASASEVLIGALKDNLKEKVQTVGVSTYGKGTKQVLIPFEDGTSLKYTETEWLTPEGTSINNIGFASDVDVEEQEIRTIYYSTADEDLDFGPDEVAINAKPLQMYLEYLGYDVDRTDTYFSQASSEALKQFQRDHDLNVTGRSDEATWKSLEENVLLELNKNEASDDTQRIKAIELIS